MSASFLTGTVSPPTLWMPYSLTSRVAAAMVPCVRRPFVTIVTVWVMRSAANLAGIGR